MTADNTFSRPVFIVSAPRSGSTLLFETLARARGLHTIGGESHRLIESIPELNIAAHGFNSNRLLAEHAQPHVAQELRRRFYSQLRDRNGHPPGSPPVRMLEKTPKNSLRIPFLVSVFPEARFVCLLREPLETMSSMMEAWRSGRFRTYPGLPGWTPPGSWSLLLTPGWRELAGKPLPEIVAGQWSACINVLLDDLEQVPRGQWTLVRYTDLLADWGGTVKKLCARLELDWDRPTTGALPYSRYTLTKPAPDKWRSNAPLLEPLLPRLRPTIERIAALPVIL